MKRENTAIIGVGAVACAACCAGPILGFLAAIGLGTAGFVLFGTAALVIGTIAIVLLLRGRRRRAKSCAVTRGPVPVVVRPTPSGPRCRGSDRITPR